MKKIILLYIFTLWVCAFANGQVTQLTDDAVQGSGLNQHNYVGSGWVHNSTTPTFYNNTLSFSSVAGNYVTFTFEGDGIEWYTEKKNWHGIAGVSIDGGSETFIDLYSSIEQHVLVYTSPVLTQGTHTIKLRATGTKNTASTGYYAIHDYFKVFTHPVNSSNDITSTYAGAQSGSGVVVDSEPPFYNTGFGYRTFASSSRHSSTAMGAYALETNGGFGSTAVGFRALKSSAGSLNTAVGYETLGNSPGEQNTAVGAYALQQSTGTHNTAVGFGALPFSPASNNTAVGYNTLWSLGQTPDLPNGIPSPPTLWLGSNNTAVGANAGPPTQTGQGVTGITNSTALGSNTKVTASHQVRIGDVNVTSIGGQVSWSTLSDGRFKQDLQEDVSGLAFVNKLRPVSYTVDKVALQKFLGVPDSLQTKVEVQQKQLRQTGFVAQEVDKLVKKSGYVFSGIDAPKNENDPYTIRYADFVVPLVKAVQELSDKNEEQVKMIADQQTQIAELLNRFEKIENANSGLKASDISLLQNTPNPFTVNTEIKMVLPETAMNANIIVYNLEGKQLKELQVKSRGNVSITILGNELSAGMYIYALIVDGKIIDTKRMILTK